MYGVPPDSLEDAPIYVGLISETRGNNGDFAFDDMGNLFLLSGNVENPAPQNEIYFVGQVPTQPSEVDLPAKALTVVDSDSNVNGIAFDAAGRLVTSSGRGLLQWFDPLNGERLKFVNSGFTGFVDLGSCAGGNTIRVQKDLPHGRFNDSDQFTLQLAGDSLQEPQTITTTGTASGLQNEGVGPLLAIDATVFTIDELPAAGTDFANYTRSWQCINQTNNDEVIASGTGFPGTVRMPSPSGEIGSSVLCTVTNRLLPEVNLSKTAVPMSGTAVEAGDELIYTVTVEVVNGPTQSDVVLTDTLGAGLEFSEVLGDPSPFELGANDTTFILPAGTDTGDYILSYSAIVTTQVANVVGNSVTGTGGGNPNGPPSDPVCAPGACATEHPLQFGVVLWKESAPETGTKVVAGQELIYTIHVDVVSSATQSDLIITDELGDGLEFGSIVERNGPFEGNSLDDLVLRAGTPPGEYSVRYSATVAQDATVSVNNAVSGTGGGEPGSPGPSCQTPNGCQTQHPIDPITTLSKTASPATGSFVKAGDTITYTLTVVVDKGPTQSPIVLTESLGEGLTLDEVVDGIFIYDATAQTFTLPAGTPSGSYDAEYTATVDEDSSISVNNSVIGTGGGYPPDPLDPNPNPNPSNPVCAPGACETQHPVTPVVELRKDADPNTGTAVEPDDLLTYTIYVNVSNGPTQSPITITDTPSDHLSFEAVEGDISPFEQGVTEGVYILPVGTPSGEYSLSYTARVDTNATVSVSNEIIGEGGGYPNDPGYVGPSCAPGACETEHPIKFAVLLSKEANPATGTSVQQGDEITFTVHVDVVYSATQSIVTITDELSPGLTYNSPNPEDILPFVEGPNQTFSLPAGTEPGEYSFSYTATVNTDATVQVNNSISGTGGCNPLDPNPSEPICDYDEDRVCSTEHPVAPIVLLSKTADPESGTLVKAGDELTYTLYVEVMNGPTQSEIVLYDTLADSLTFGEVVDSGGFEYEVSDNLLIFRRAAGAETGMYQISYTATVADNAQVSVDNSVSGTGGGDPGAPTPSRPICQPQECETTHPLVPPVFTPVPLGSWPWNALLIGLLAVLAVSLVGRRPAY